MAELKLTACNNACIAVHELDDPEARRRSQRNVGAVAIYA